MPILSKVAATGSYNDLRDKPTIALYRHNIEITFNNVAHLHIKLKCDSDVKIDNYQKFFDLMFTKCVDYSYTNNFNCVDGQTHTFSESQYVMSIDGLGWEVFSLDGDE